MISGTRPGLRGVYLVLLLLAASNCIAQSPVGIVIFASGNEAVITRGSSFELQAGRLMDIVLGDIVQTGSSAYLMLRMNDSGQIQLSCNTHLQFNEYPRNQNLTRVELELLQGSLRIIGGRVKGDAYKLLTPVAELQQENATFEVIEESPTVFLFAVFEGNIRLNNSRGVVTQDASMEPRYVRFPRDSMPTVISAEEYYRSRAQRCPEPIFRPEGL